MSAIFAFTETGTQATALANELKVPLHAIECRVFPDGESLVRIPAEVAAVETAILYRSLNDPNAKLIEILLAAAALRDNGARRVVLVAPYLGYMRQDIAFRPGEAVSQRVIGQLIADHFDGLVTVDPHLHRVAALGEVVPGIAATAIPAAPAIAAALHRDLDPASLLIGPDRESLPWVRKIAELLGIEMIIAKKHRGGDREVRIILPEIEQVRDRPALIIDDLVSSGSTLVACAAQLRAAGAARVEAVATHCLADAADLARLRAAGIDRLRASDSVNGPAAVIPLAAVLADAVRTLGWLDSAR
ncbi:ribose-phosphate diphosphokinase [Sphingopyxis fribergensis]